MDNIVVIPAEPPKIDIKKMPRGIANAFFSTTGAVVEKFFEDPEHRKGYEEWYLNKYGVSAPD